MDRLRLTTPFSGKGDLRSVAIAVGCVYLILALVGASAGFAYRPLTPGIGFYGENYLLMILGISSVVWIISNIVLIHEAIKRRHNFLLPWIYWQLVFVIIAIMVLIWSSILMAELRNYQDLADRLLMDAMIAALCCVVPFLLTVIYSIAVVYSFYCDLKGVKRKEDVPDASASRTNMMPPGSGTSHRPQPFPPRAEERTHEDVRMHALHSNLHVMPPGTSTSHRQPPIPPRTDENIYEDPQMPNACRNLRSNAAQTEEGETYSVYAYTLPDRLPGTAQFK